jgi:hypothetical protein
VGTNGRPQGTGSPASASPSGHADSSGRPAAAPSDPGHGGEGAGDGCARIMPTAREPNVGSRAMSGAGPRYRIRPGPNRGHQLERGAHTSGARGTVPGPGSDASARQRSRSALRSTPPGDGDLDAAVAYRPRWQTPALPFGQQLARGAWPPGTGRRRRAPARCAGKGGHRSGSTTDTDLGRGRTAPSRGSMLPTASRLIGPERQVVPSHHRL